MGKCETKIAGSSAYHFKECGLDYVYLLNGYEIESDPNFGDSITIYNESKLHREIARSVLLYKAKLEGQDIRFFRSLLRLTQEQLANKFDASRETVVRWENNDREISSTADSLLRIIVWEKYLNQDKAVKFFEEHKKDRVHYEILEMIESKNNWKSKIAA